MVLVDISFTWHPMSSFAVEARGHDTIHFSTCGSWGHDQMMSRISTI